MATPPLVNAACNCGSVGDGVAVAVGVAVGAAVGADVLVKVAVGVAVAGIALATVIWRVTLDEPPGPVTVKKTLYVPGVSNTCCGFLSVLALPSLKFHR